MVPAGAVEEFSLLAVLAGSVLIFSVVVDDYLTARFVSRLLIAVSITAVSPPARRS